MVSAVPPAVPLVRSHALKVRPPVSVLVNPDPLGTKRTRSDPASRRAEPLDDPTGMSVQAPLPTLYCQVPLVLVTPVMAMPSGTTVTSGDGLPYSASVAVPEEASSAVTVVPVLAASAMPWSMAARRRTSLDRIGLSLAPETLRVTCCETVRLPSETVKVMVP